jgi:hypothetical protein
VQLGEEDAMNRVSTNGLFVTFFFQIGIMNYFNVHRQSGQMATNKKDGACLQLALT